MSDFERQCYDWGWQDNEERIIKLLEAKYATYPVEKWLDKKALILTLIALIKGESK
jgi:hypothetical protein